MLRPRLLDLLSRRWYSMGDCKAEKRRRATSTPVTIHNQASGIKRHPWFLTVQEVALGFQDLHHVIDPGPAGLGGRGLQLEANHAPVRVA